MYIVGFTGPINHGKSTAAALLNAEEPYSKHIESRFVIAEVAEKLNKKFDPELVMSHDLTSVNGWIYNLLDILPEVLNIRPSFDQIEIREHEIERSPELFEKLFIYIDRLREEPELIEQTIDDDNSEEHRPILQWLGAYLPSVLTETLWFDEVMRRVNQADDSTKLYTISGLRYPADAGVVRHFGGKIIEIIRPDYEEDHQTDPTEANRKNITPDTVILNNGDLGDLKHVMNALWQDLQADRLRFEYKSIN